jgi:hypothetical protein
MSERRFPPLGLWTKSDACFVVKDSEFAINSDALQAGNVGECVLK